MAYKNKKKKRQNEKEYYQKNREKILQKKKEYYQRNKEIIQKRMKSYGKKWYQRNKNKIQLKHREYYRKNKEKIDQYLKKWYKNNKEKILQYSKEYYQKNRKELQQRHKEYNQNNKERLLQYKGSWQKYKREIDPKYRLDANMGTAVWQSLRNKTSETKWYEENKEKIEEKMRKWREKNRGKKITKREWQKMYWGIRKQFDPKYRLDQNTGNVISLCLKSKKAGWKWETLVGYTIEDLIRHLEKQFDSKMNWNNYGNYWAIDHIKAKSLFNYTSPNDLEFKHCWTLENLQPLEKIKNIKKGNRI